MCPENFASRAALVAAEIARIERRELDASVCTKRQSARRTQTALFKMRRSQTNSLRVSTRHVVSRRSRILIYEMPGIATSVGSRWQGAATRSALSAPQGEELVSGRTSTIETPVGHLDLATVIKVSQAVSGEIVLEKLIDTLMRTAIEHAGAERGLLILREVLSSG